MGEPWTVLAVRNCLSLSRFILTFSSPIYPFYICFTSLNSFICVPFHSKSLDMQFRKPRFLSIYPEVLTNPQRLFKILRPAQTLVIDTFIELFSFFLLLHHHVYNINMHKTYILKQHLQEYVSFMFTVSLYIDKILQKQMLLSISCVLHLCLNIYIIPHLAFVKVCMCLPLMEYSILLS